MPTEILLYANINDDSATKFVTELEAAASDDIKVRVNSNGGEVNCAWALVSKLTEHPLKKEVVVDGKALSSACFFLLYADEVTCKDVSQFMFHRAAYPDFIEENPTLFSDTMRSTLSGMNAKLKAAFDARIDAVALQAIMDKKPELKGAKVKDIFSMDKRIEIRLNALEAKKIGLVKTIVNITPKAQEEIDKIYAEASAVYAGLPVAKEVEKPKEKTIMDLATLKTEHPAVYAAAFSAGEAAGIKKEKDRVGSWAPFISIDAKAALDGIKGDEVVSATAISEFTVKSFSSKSLQEIEATAVDPAKVKTTEAEAGKTEKATALAEFEAAVKSNASLIS